MNIKGLFFLLLLLAASSTYAQQLYLNEVLSTGSPDWIEIYNPNNQDVDITGWNIWDPSTVGSHYVLPSSTIIPANGFLVLSCDDQNTGLHTNFKLSSGGETIWFANAANVLVDTVVFPSLTSGTSYGRNPDGAQVFAIFTTPTQGFTNVIPVNLPPIIGMPTQIPVYPLYNEEVTITVSVTDDSGISPDVILYYDAEEGYKSIIMEPIISTTNFKAVIPVQSGGRTVKYYIIAKDNLNAISLNPAGAPTTYFSYLVYWTPQKVYINEIMASNVSEIQDPDYLEYVDFIELYNSTDSPVDVRGWFMTDNSSNTTKWKFPNSSVIASKGFLLVWADNKDTAIIAPHTNFALSKNGEFVGLYNADSIMVDTVTFCALTDNGSYFRNTDGYWEWLICYGGATPGTPNPMISVEKIEPVLSGFTLNQNYPNPFNPSTKIRFSLPASGNSALNAVVKVYDVLGNLVATLVNEKLDAGTYEVTFNASNLSSGIYFYSLQYGSYNQTCKMSLIK